MSWAVKTSGIYKRYGTLEALKNIELKVKKGELFGLIGPDGAGKTSLIRILATLLLADEGKANVIGKDVVQNYAEIRAKMGYMPGKFSLYPDLSVEENMKLFASIYKTTIEENYHLVKDIYSQIEPFKKRKAGQLSGGMKQKLALSCAMIHEPEILFLDEPTTGVDAVSRNEFWDMLKRLRNRGITIIVSTPYMDEAELCDRVALIQDGELLSVNTPMGIVNEFPKKLFSIRGSDKYQLLQRLKAYEYTHSVYAFGGTFHYTDTRDNIDDSLLKSELLSTNLSSIEVKTIEPEIEDCFIALMNHEHHG